MTTTLTYTGQLTVVTCWCGMHHAVPSDLRDYQLRRFDGGGKPVEIYCPLGHTHIPSGEPKAERLARELEMSRQRTRAERELRQDTERRLSAQKSATTRARKRAAAAVCPCCSRSFVQLRRHMAAKHPDYDPACAS